MNDFTQMSRIAPTDQPNATATVLDADWTPNPPSEEDLIRRGREQEAVLRKWRDYTYTQRIVRAAWDKVIGLMIAAGTIFLWALALAVLVGIAAR